MYRIGRETEIVCCKYKKYYNKVEIQVGTVNEIIGMNVHEVTSHASYLESFGNRFRYIFDFKGLNYSQINSQRGYINFFPSLTFEKY